MCLILTVWKGDPRYDLVVAANRDEFHERPAAAASFWDDGSGILAGRDLLAGGTWMGMTRSGRFAAITNFAGQTTASPDAPSRGSLVTGFLRGVTTPFDYLDTIARRGSEYAGFSLFAGTAGELAWYSNHGSDPVRLAPGRYGLANALLDSDWPKVARGKDLVDAVLSRHADADETIEGLLDALTEGRDEPFEAASERCMEAVEDQRRSRLFLRHPLYGTRASTVVLVDTSGDVRFVERTWTPGGEPGEQREFRFTIERSSD